MQNKVFKRPESILLVVYTIAGEVLLLKRLTPPVGIWQSVTGSLQWHEQVSQTVNRELFEETGITTSIKPVATGTTNRFTIVPEVRHLYAPEVWQNTEYVFTLRLEDRVPVRLSKEEHSEYCWMSFDDGINLVWSWSNKNAIRAVQQMYNS